MLFKTIENGEMCNTGSFEVGKIFVYGNGTILYETKSNYFEEYKESTNASGYSSLSTLLCGRPEIVYLKNDFKRANKLNLERTDNFFMTYNDELWGRRTALYIHISEIEVLNICEKMYSGNDHERNYIMTCQLVFKHGATFRKTNIEKIECENYTLQPNERFNSCYGSDIDHKTVEIWHDRNGDHKGIIKRWMSFETFSTYSMLTTCGYICRTEKSEQRENLEKIADIMSKIYGKHISYYDVERMQNELNITIKGE